MEPRFTWFNVLGILTHLILYKVEVGSRLVTSKGIIKEKGISFDSQFYLTFPKMFRKYVNGLKDKVATRFVRRVKRI